MFILFLFFTVNIIFFNEFINLKKKKLLYWLELFLEKNLSKVTFLPYIFFKYFIVSGNTTFRFLGRALSVKVNV